MQTASPQPHAAEPLARLLLQWGVAPPAAVPVAERLGSWLGWADAIVLSQLLSAAPAAADKAPAPQATQDWAHAALERVQAELLAGFDEPLLAHESTEPAPDGVPLADLLAPYRLHHAQQQRSIAARAASLRERLQARLTDASPGLAQLAQLDALFDRALALRQRQALAGLPALLSRRAEHHHHGDPRHWRRRFWADLQRALRAELDLRLQPVLGLLDALQAPPAPTEPAASPAP